jgi:hypothetical protein
MGHQNRSANNHQRKARQFLAQAQDATDLDRRQKLVNLCEQELVAAVAARRGERSGIDRRKARRRSSDV